MKSMKEFEKMFYDLWCDEKFKNSAENTGENDQKMEMKIRDREENSGVERREFMESVFANKFEPKQREDVFVENVFENVTVLLKSQSLTKTFPQNKSSRFRFVR